jgi:hypothetical protein
MIQKQQFNEIISKEVHDALSFRLEVKGCYMNIYRVVCHYRDYFDSGQWRVAYGYIRPVPEYDLMVRHCYIVTSEGKAIDPTHYTTERMYDGHTLDFTSFYIFDDIKSYFAAIRENDNRPDLGHYFRKKEWEEAHPWAREEGIVLAG